MNLKSDADEILRMRIMNVAVKGLMVSVEILYECDNEQFMLLGM